MITGEIIEKVFGVYLHGSFVYRDGEDKGKRYPYPNVFPLLAKYATIELKSLSHITDEEAIEVCVINGDTRPEDNTLLDEEFKEGLDSAKEDIIASFKPWDGSGNGYIECRNAPFIIDYLRSKGYALPAFGYSVDQLIESGVFKLKTPTPNGK